MLEFVSSFHSSSPFFRSCNDMNNNGHMQYIQVDSSYYTLRNFGKACYQLKIYQILGQSFSVLLIKVNLRNSEYNITYAMVWMALGCNYSINLYCDFLYPLSAGNILFLFTHHIFYPICSIFQIFQKQTAFVHMLNLWVRFIRKLLSSVWFKTLKPSIHQVW